MNRKFETLLIATKNPAKESRYREIFAQYAVRVIGLQAVAATASPEECGATAEENAAIKARFYARQTDHAVFAEDEALYVDFLPQENQPGVHVRRINGQDEATDEQLFAHWKKMIANVPFSERKGRWHVAYCIARSDGMVTIFTIDIPIAFFSPPSPVKIPGWPMSSLQGPLGFGKPHSELTDAERQQANQKIDQAIAKAIEGMIQARIDK